MLSDNVFVHGQIVVFYVGEGIAEVSNLEGRQYYLNC
jgi:hypothetical protein